MYLKAKTFLTFHREEYEPLQCVLCMQKFVIMGVGLNGLRLHHTVFVPWAQTDTVKKKSFLSQPY